MNIEDVKAIYAAQVARYGRGPDAVQATRTEVHAALQIEKPLPYSSAPKHIPVGQRMLSHAEATEVRLHQIDQIDEAAFDEAARAMALESDRTRPRDPQHYHQREHGRALWEETDDLCREAGVLP